MAEAVKVVVRCRPLNSKEKEDGRKIIVSMDKRAGSVTLKNPNGPNEAAKPFTFDAVYPMDTRQREIYDETVFPLVESVLEGYNGTILAYGQTGTGKTFTMSGVPSDPELRGVIPNAFEHIFDHINTKSSSGDETKHLVRASFLEIYNEEIRDLIGPDPKQKLDLKENPDTGVYVKSLSQYVVKDIPEMEHWMDVGNANRSVGFTKMNAGSSRSHSMFTITIESSSRGPTGEEQVRAGKLHLVDLAGSERQSKTEAEGLRLKEAAKINLSLSALGNVIAALVDGKSQHIPYRDSKLTRLLQDSLGGNAKTCMIANMGPADWNYDESLSTLRYANRAKNIKNKPKINEDPKDALIRQFQEEINKLKAALSAQGGAIPLEGEPTEVIVEEEEEETFEDMAKQLEGIDAELLKKMKSEKEEEILKILSEKGVLESERQRIANQLLEMQQKDAKRKAEKLELQQKLENMQGKLLIGGKNLLDEHTQQQQKLRQQARELEQKAIEEQRMKREIARKAEEIQLQEEKFNSLEEEIESKTKKLKKLWNKIQEAKTEMNDLTEEFQTEKADLLHTIRELSKQLKLKLLLINSFVPPEELARIERRATWDEELGDWKIFNVEYAGNSIRKQRGDLIDIEQNEAGSQNGGVEVHGFDSIPNTYFTYTQPSNGEQNKKKAGSGRRRN